MDRYDGVPITQIWITKFHMWVHLYNLPLGYFYRTMLQKVTSAIGNFIDVSSLPEDQPSEVASASFAKVLVEMGINGAIVPSFLVQLSGREPFRIFVRYLKFLKFFSSVG